MRPGTWIAAIAGVLLLSAATAAHHSVGGQFDVSKTMTLTGTVVRVVWRNPHPFIVLEVDGPSGAVEWQLSTHPTAMLAELGVTRGLLAGKPGDTLTAIVHPALNGRPVAWVARLTYPDGRSLSLFEP